MDVELLLARDLKSDEVNVANSLCTKSLRPHYTHDLKLPVILLIQHRAVSKIPNVIIIMRAKTDMVRGFVPLVTLLSCNRQHRLQYNVIKAILAT
jgi:hypothetical protein